MYQPIKGGSTMRISFDDEYLDVHLPPVGYVIDRLPDPKTGLPSGKLIKSEILFNDLPKKDQKWKRPRLPQEWRKWIAEEKQGQKTDPNFYHRELNAFRAQEWRRRINGVWIALGNRNSKPSEYYYLTGLAYFYFAWWVVDFIPKFRVVYLKIFYALQWGDDNPNIHGVTASTLRRFGKTAIAFCWQYEFVSRNRFVYGGMQAKVYVDAKKKFKINVVDPWKRLPEFFRPKFFDRKSYATTILNFTKNNSTGENAEDTFEEDNALNSHIDFRESKEGAYDNAKVHRYVAEEPGKWEEADFYSTIKKIIPATKDLNTIIGKIFAPTTVEELEKGGAVFIDFFEDSFPSHYHKMGTTKSGLVSVFIPAYEAFVFDEFGRSVIDDPGVKNKIYGEDGKLITEGAKTILLRNRKVFEGDSKLLTEEMRKYPFTWAEAKSVSNQFCHFNAMLIQQRIMELEKLETPLWVRGNLDWVREKDGEVDFVRDDLNGRFQFAWLPDANGGNNDGDQKIINNVGEDYDDDGKTVWFPKNDKYFTIGSDPIRYDSTDDPRASKAAAYVFQKLDVRVDNPNAHRDTWKTHRPIVQYIHRPPEFDIYAEDMIKLMRFFGCSILPEDNVQVLRKHLDARGYGRFLLYRSDFDDNTLKLDKDGVNANKGIGSQEEVIDKYMNLENTYFNRHINKIVFIELLRDALVHRLAKGKTKDSVVAFGFTLLANEARIEDNDDSNGDADMAPLDLFPVFDNSGPRGTPINHREQWKRTA